MSAPSKILRNSATLITQSILSLLVSLLVNGYVAKKLGASDYGKFVFAFSFATMFYVFCDMGFYGWGVREIARDRERTAEILGDITVTRTFLSCLVFACVCTVISLLGYPDLTRLAGYIGAASVILCNTQFTNAWIVFEAHEKLKYEGMSNVISRVLVGAISVYLMYFGYGLIPLCLGYVTGSLVQVIYCYVILKRHFVLPRIKVGVSKYLAQMRKALPFALFSVFFVIYYEIDKNMLLFMKGDTAVGLYNAATAIVYKGAIVSSSIAIATLPTMIDRFKRSVDELSEFLAGLMPVLMMIGLPIAIVGTTAGEQIIELIYRSTEYQPSIMTLKILIWMVPLEFLSHVTRFSLIAAKKEIKTTLSMGGGVILNIGLNLILIPKYGPNGAALATVATESLVLFAQMGYFHRYVHNLGLGRKAGVILLANSGLLLVTLLLLSDLSFYALFISIPLYLAFLIFARIVGREELKILQIAFGRKGFVE